MNVKFAIVDDEKSLAQQPSQQGGGCVIFNALPVEDCVFGREASFFVRVTGAFIYAPAPVQGLFIKEVSVE